MLLAMSLQRMVLTCHLQILYLAFVEALNKTSLTTQTVGTVEEMDGAIAMTSRLDQEVVVIVRLGTVVDGEVEDFLVAEIQKDLAVAVVVVAILVVVASIIIVVVSAVDAVAGVVATTTTGSVVVRIDMAVTVARTMVTMMTIAASLVLPMMTTMETTVVHLQLKVMAMTTNMAMVAVGRHMAPIQLPTSTPTTETLMTMMVQDTEARKAKISMVEELMMMAIIVLTVEMDMARIESVILMTMIEVVHKHRHVAMIWNLTGRKGDKVRSGRSLFTHSQQLLEVNSEQAAVRNRSCSS
jgi:hypothetical protein